MKKIITPKIFRSVFNRAIFEILFKGLEKLLDFDQLGLQKEFFTQEDFNYIKDSYEKILSMLRYTGVDIS